MLTADPELLVGTVLVAALLLAPLASRLIADVGREVSAELDGGRTGSSLARHLDRSYADRAGAEGAARRTEIRQLLEARAYRQARRGEIPIDVEAELRRILAEDRQPSL